MIITFISDNRQYDQQPDRAELVEEVVEEVIMIQLGQARRVGDLEELSENYINSHIDCGARFLVGMRSSRTTEHDLSGRGQTRRRMWSGEQRDKRQNIHQSSQ